MASNGHLWTQMPHPMQRVSEMIGLPVGPSTMHSWPMRTGGQ